MPTSLDDNLSAKATLTFLRWNQSRDFGFPAELKENLNPWQLSVVTEAERRQTAYLINATSKANANGRAKALLTADGAAAPEAPLPLDWLCDSDAILDMEMEPRRELMVDSRTGGVFLYGKSINQIFATRGLGKSVVVNALLPSLLRGGEWLHFRSPGGLKVVLVDAELPDVQIKERLKEFTGKADGRLKIISKEFMPNPKAFPVLSRLKDQAEFLRQIEGFAPDVLIFDTLTSCFKFDTNDTDKWLAVNDFLMDLRFRGYCVLIVHHAGKNNTQRGRTDGDDNLDVTVQLNKRDGWEPGDGLQFKWEYEKVRHGGYLQGFEAGYVTELGQPSRWTYMRDNKLDKVAEMLADGKSQAAIGKELKISQSTVSRLIKKVEERQERLDKLNEHAVYSRE